MDAKLTKTQNGQFDGKEAAGAPEWVVKLGSEWDLSRMPGLTATARLQYASSQAFNADNTIKVPSWARLDVGARYAIKINGRPVIFRASVENVTDRRYWDTVPSYQIATYAAPRTILLSTTIDF
ncbi:TonB-dependent receptor domain-containing protein [Candidatus Nitrotoga arctica]|uniref:Ferrichrome-iron receptor n=1 Tax=Candidatus Nitrotoga arctica TaxID=453162 RepID=A0ABM8Z1P2_9PROT|nr:TonB-dependent receptor [Candidatus Nitrotoga arctica]CAG9933834.1 Ferrichrome-iron receptor [Candidatus Nitrotoga arctica]